MLIKEPKNTYLITSQINNIMSNLSVNETLQLSQVNKNLASICGDEHVWYLLFKRDYPQYDCLLNKPLLRTWKETIIQYTKIGNMKLKYDPASFLKLCRYYNKHILNGLLTEIFIKYQVKDWTLSSDTSESKQLFYQISSYSVLLFTLTNVQYYLNKFQCRTQMQLIQYLVEEFIMDILSVINKKYSNNSVSMMDIKKEVNNTYFKHKLILPVEILNTDHFKLICYDDY